MKLAILLAIVGVVFGRDRVIGFHKKGIENCYFDGDYLLTFDDGVSYRDF